MRLLGWLPLALLAIGCDDTPAPDPQRPANALSTDTLASKKTLGTPQPTTAPPGGPVPIPYPNLASAPASSTQIKGKEATLKNKSTFKQSSGDEAR